MKYHDLKKAENSLTFKSHMSEVASVSLNLDDSLIASGSRDGNIFIHKT